MYKILLIEDDPTMLSLLSTLLEFEGFRVASLNGASGIEKILERMRSERPALILLDVHLPGVSGIDLMRRVRTDEVLKTAKVLMSSGMNLSIESRQAGADGFILKPYMPEELVKKIHETINNG
jgi:DNA-binding response OmpR family regulator